MDTSTITTQWQGEKEDGKLAERKPTEELDGSIFERRAREADRGTGLKRRNQNTRKKKTYYNCSRTLGFAAG